MSAEVWLPVPFDQRYDVSDQGRVRSWTYRGNRANRRLESPVELKPYPDGRSYLQVDFAGKTYRVHVLVMLAFVGSRPDGFEVCHRDGNTKNNCLENLRYDTPSGNSSDKSFSAPLRKLTAEESMEIRRRLRAGSSMSELAREFVISTHSVRDIRDCRTWKTRGEKS